MRALCREGGYRVDQGWSKDALVELLLSGRPTDEVSTEFDEHRERIIEYVNRHRNQLRGVLHCPILDDERGCFQCSDAMVTTCTVMNEDKMND